jgi:hypothetical protein
MLIDPPSAVGQFLLKRVGFPPAPIFASRRDRT